MAKINQLRILHQRPLTVYSRVMAASRHLFVGRLNWTLCAGNICITAPSINVIINFSRDITRVLLSIW